jgi:mannose-1-phosphate guanylyltransferase / phosphomannomutase
MDAIVILVGGKGTRVNNILKGKSKPEIEIGFKRKIIDFQLEKLIELKKKIFFLSNIRFKSLKKYITKNYSNKINFEFIEEKEALGTAGCLKVLNKKKYNNFLIIDGDLIFNIDFKKFLKFHKTKNSDCTLFVHPNNHPYDSDAVEINEKLKVKKIFPKKKILKPNLCLSGIRIIKKKMLNHIVLDKYQDFTDDFLKKIYKKKKNIYAYNSREYIKDVGTLNRIKQAKRDIKTNKFKLGTLQKKIPAIFLDKDGVIIKLNKNKHYQDNKNIYKFSYKALSKINNSEFLCVLITNQPAVAKGIISLNKLKRDFKKLDTILGLKNVYFDRVYYCPHHPEKGFKGENKKYKINCNCRKPKNGMLTKAIKDLNIDKKKSFMLGDSVSDLFASKKTNIKFIKIGKEKFPKKNKNLNKKNLLDAVNYILN